MSSQTPSTPPQQQSIWDILNNPQTLVSLLALANLIAGLFQHHGVAQPQPAPVPQPSPQPIPPVPSPRWPPPTPTPQPTPTPSSGGGNMSIAGRLPKHRISGGEAKITGIQEGTWDEAKQKVTQWSEV